MFFNGPGETGKPCKKAAFCVVASQGNSGNKVGKWKFLELKSNNCVEFCVFNIFS